MKPGYYVYTWDGNKEEFTPQRGVRKGPYTLFSLRKALRALRGMGYDATRFPRGGYGDYGDPSVYVERVDR